MKYDGMPVATMRTKDEIEAEVVRLREVAHAKVTNITDNSPELFALFALAWTLGPEAQSAEITALSERVAAACNQWRAPSDG